MNPTPMGYLVLRHSMPSALSARWTPIGVGKLGGWNLRTVLDFFLEGRGGRGGGGGVKVDPILVP